MEEMILDYDKGNIIELNNIFFEIAGRRILNNINLGIKKNNITLIYGKSGSGKSTLLNIMNMLYKVKKGTYKFDDFEVDFDDENKTSDIRKKIGFFHQELALMENLTIQENLEIFSKIIDKPIDGNMLNEYLELLDIKKIYKVNVSKLSGGERQRAAFLKLLILPYEVIFIDEPTNNLDTENIKVIENGIKKLKEQGKTVVVVSHYIPLQKVADIVIDLEKING
jgi:putative ABC transport system ATP-binding protein